MYLLRLVEKVADSTVVVKSVDNVRNVLAKVDLLIPFSRKKLGSSVHKVCGEYLRDSSLFVRLVHILKTVTEETEGSEYEYSLCALSLKLLSYVDNGITRGDHIVDDDNVLILYVTAEILVRNDGILTVNDNGIVTALIEHTEVDTHNG